MRTFLAGHVAWLVPLGLVALAFIVYGSTFGNAWTYDDFPVVVDNQQIRSWSDFLTNSFRPGGRLLREFTYLVDYRLFGLEPAGYHVQNILWHAFNGGLLFTLVRAFGGSGLAALLAALLFLVHPLQVEVVANISHRKDSLVLCFALLSLLAFHRAAQRPERRIAWLFWCGFCFVLALYAKQSALALPLIFVAYELCLPPERRLFLKRARHWLALAAGGVLLLGGWLATGGPSAFVAAAQGHLGRQNFFGTETFDVVLAHFRMVLKAWLFLWSKFLWPVDLAVEYTPGVPASWADPWVAGCLGLLLASGGFTWALWRRGQRMAVFVILATFCAWLPTSSVLPLSYYAADRYLYMPSTGVFAAAGLGLAWLVSRQRVAGAIACIALLVLLAVLTVKQNRVWRSPETLWTQALAVSPKSAYALNNMGMVHFEKGELQRAYDYFLEAVRNDPYNPTAQYNLGYLNERFGRPDKALPYYLNFLALEDPMFTRQREQLRLHLKQRYGVDAGRAGGAQ